MVTPRPRGRKPPPEEISPQGRIAGITVAVALATSEVAFLVASWDELRCTRAGARCDDIAGIGGAVSLAALAVTIAGVASVIMTWRRAGCGRSARCC